MGKITLFEGNNASQEVVARYDDAPFEGKIQPNDKAKSAKLENVKVGCKIAVYDINFNYTSFEVMKEVPEIVIPSFEPGFYNENVKITFYRDYGTYGKAFYIKIE